MHVQHAQLDKTCQPFPQDDVETLLLTDVILPDEYDLEMAEEDRDRNQFWTHPRYFNADERAIVQNYLRAVEEGLCSAETATADLISFNLFPYEMMLGMYAVFLRALEAGETA